MLRRVGLALLLLAIAGPRASAQIVAQGAPATTSDARAWPFKIVFGGVAVDPRDITDNANRLLGKVTFGSAQPVTQSGAWAISFTVPQHVIVDSASLGTVAVSGPVTDAELRASPVIVAAQVGGLAVTGSIQMMGTTDLSAIEPVRITDDGEVKTVVGNGAGAAAVNVQDGGNTLTVDGTVTANAGTGTFAVSAAALPLPAGAATEATLSSLNGKVTAVNTGAVTISSALPPGTNAIGKLAANSGVDVGDVTVDNGAGAAAVNIQDGGNTITVDGTVSAAVTQAVASLLNATVVQATASSLNAQVQGPAASGAAKSGNPVQQGGVYNGTQPTVTTGQAVEAQMTARGAQIVSPGIDLFPVQATISGSVTVANGGTFAVQDAQAEASLSVLDDWDESDRAKVNLIVGQAGIAAGTGVDGATVPRVSLATNVPLPAGTNGIGKLTANSGVDIGDVTVDGSVAVTGNVTVVQPTGTNLHVVVDAAPTTAVTNAGLTALNGAIAGTEVQVDVLTLPNVTIGAAIPAGNNNVGDVDVASLPSLVAGTANIGDVDVLTLPALVAGTANIGDVDVLTLPALVAGSAIVGKVGIDQTTPGTTNRVDVGTFPDNEPINVAQVNGVAPSMGNGPSGAGVTRMTLADDSTGRVSTKTALTANAPGTGSVGVASGSLVASNAGRKGLVLVNLSNATVCLGIGATAVLNSGICLQPSGAWTMNEYTMATGAINAIASAAASTVSVQEFQ